MKVGPGAHVDVRWSDSSPAQGAGLEAPPLDPERHLFAVGPFRVLKEGFDAERGGHAAGYHNAVLFAEDPAGREVVLKVTKNPHGLAEDALRAEVLHEAEALRVLGESRRIPDLRGVGRVADGSYVVAMGRARGRSLASVEADSPRAVAELMDRVFAAVESVHKRGFLHGDLHKGNVLATRKRDGSYSAQIIDVGTAVRLGADGRYTGPRLGGDWIASAPEQMPDAQGNVTLTRASDVYFAGVLLAQKLVGRNPFKPDVPREPWDAYLAASIELRRQRDPLPELAAGPLKDVLLRALAWAPEDRFQTIGALREALVDARDRDPLFTARTTVKALPDGLLVGRVGLRQVEGQSLGAPWGRAFVAPGGTSVKLGFAQVYPLLAGALGAPKQDEVEGPAGTVQAFEHGRLVWDRATNQIRAELGP